MRTWGLESAEVLGHSAGANLDQQSKADSGGGGQGKDRRQESGDGVGVDHEVLRGVGRRDQSTTR